jgi:hypothetical protein
LSMCICICNCAAVCCLSRPSWQLIVCC